MKTKKTRQQPVHPTVADSADTHPRHRFQAYEPDHPSDGRPLNAEDVRGLLCEVCMLASIAIRVSRPRVALDFVDEEDDDRDDRIQMLRQTLDRIGWVADVAQRKLGGTGSFARAEDWMLPGV